MVEAEIESGFAKVAEGTWLAGRGQPSAFLGETAVKGLRGFIVPDRSAVSVVTAAASAWFSRADAPFLARLDALPDEPLKVVSRKLLVAPFSSRVGAKSLKLVPLSFQRSIPVTHFNLGWAIVATRSRTIRLSVGEGETLSVRPDALVAWIGPEPTGFCPKLSLWDMLLPRGPKNLVYSFHGPCVVWAEGTDAMTRRDSASTGRRGGRA